MFLYIDGMPYNKDEKAYEPCLSDTPDGKLTRKELLALALFGTEKIIEDCRKSMIAASDDKVRRICEDMHTMFEKRNVIQAELDAFVDRYKED